MWIRHMVQVIINRAMISGRKRLLLAHIWFSEAQKYEIRRG